MRIAQPLAVILLASLATGCLSACNSFRKVGNAALPGQPFEMKQKVLCKQDNKDYVGARELPPLKAPAGLESPDTRNTLRVPTLNTPERPRGRDEACLDLPPTFTTAKTIPAAPAPVAPPAKPREVPTE